MKLTLRIVNADDVLAEQDRTRTWDGEGGSIGRIAGNDWVLPDPRSEISRVHARVYFKNNLYYIEDLSTNGVFVGDMSHRIDRVPHAMTHGDVLFIGHYKIEVDLEEEQQSYDEFAPSNHRVSVPDVGLTDAADSLSQQVSNIASLSFEEFPESSRKESSSSADQSSASVIPENWLDNSIDSVVSDWATPGGGRAAISSLSDMLAETPKKPSPPPKPVVSTQTQKEPEYALEKPLASEVADKASTGGGLAEHLVAQRVAFEKTLDAIFELFDDDYIECVIMKEGESRQDLVKRLYEEVFNEAYKAKLKKS